MTPKVLKIGFPIIIVFCLLLSGCVNVSPSLHPEITPALPVSGHTDTVSSAAATAAPDITPAPAAERSTDASAFDALGNLIYGTDHFEQYLQFLDIRVYEDGADTLLDCSVLNNYPDTICCAVNIRFYDENRETIAQGSLQMPDGSYMLYLKPGVTPLYASILTDISLPDKEFELIFDPNVEVKPLSSE